MKKKILIDSSSLLSPFTGIGNYTYEVSKRLLEIDELDLNFYYGYVSKKLISPSNRVNVKNSKPLISKNDFIKKVVRKLLVINSKLLTKKVDLYWQPNFILNASIKSKFKIVSVHDFSFHLYPNWHPKERIEYFKNNFWKNINSADFIITGSNYSKNEILEYLNFPEEKIKVIYHGVANEYKIYPKELLDSFSKHNNLPNKFILFVGSIEPRKNLLNLLKAYDLLNNELKQKYKLLLVGFSGWENVEIMNLINKNIKNVTYLGYLSNLELAYIYNLSTIFIFPSYYEGFGIPPIEAMACKTPVIVSNISSIPEVCEEDSAIYCNPHSITDIRDKIELILNSENLQKELIYKGLNRAKKFTWEKSAKEHLRVFQKFL